MMGRYRAMAVVAHAHSDERRSSGWHIPLAGPDPHRGALRARDLSVGSPGRGLELVYLAVCDGLGPTLGGEWLGPACSLLLWWAEAVVTTTWPVPDHAQGQTEGFRSRAIDERVWNALVEALASGRHPADTLAEVLRCLCDEWETSKGIPPFWWGSLTVITSRPLPSGEAP
jgi:hypothetical protein